MVDTKPGEQKIGEQITIVWESYCKYHPRTVFTHQRRELIRRRLVEGFPFDLLVDAIAGNHADPFCSGENDRYKRYHGLSLILRDADHIERYAELAAADRPVDPVESAWRTFAGWQDRSGTELALELAEGTFPDEIVAAIRSRVEGEPVE